jgi:glycosyltransferase involved in cell wall biosynthesis
VKLVASVIVRNEAGRYLEACLRSLLEFCDEIRVLDDGSTDGWTREFASPEIIVRYREQGIRVAGKDFRDHAAARNDLAAFTLESDATHVLAIDADEFVDDGAAVRAACQQSWAPGVSLVMTEVWEATEDGLCVREDGGWAPRDVMMVWRTDASGARSAIWDLGPATGRTPTGLGHIRTIPSGARALHFGWAAEDERQERFDKYMAADGGRFHARAHLESIMWPCDRIRLSPLEWPKGLTEHKPKILARCEQSRP